MPEEKRDLAITEDDTRPGKALLHIPDCPMVQDHRTAGRAIMTMWGCEDPTPQGVREHSCLKAKYR